MLDWLEPRWTRLIMSLVTTAAVTLWLWEYRPPWRVALAIAGLGVAAAASWWVDWPKEEKDEWA